MKGHRLPDGFEPTKDWYAKVGITDLPKGAFFKDSNMEWSVVTPNGRLGLISKHTVVEHDDGTITVSPSILVYPVEPKTYTAEERQKLVDAAGEDYARSWEAGKPGWHGFLEHGVWREV